MAAVEVPQTLEYKGGQLNATPVLEVENCTNYKKRFMCHIIGIESQFEKSSKNVPFIPMTAGQRKPKNQWTGDERKAANLDQRLKKGSSDVKESRVMDLKLCYNTFKFKEDSELASLFGKLKYEENLIDNIYETEKNKSLVSATPLSTAFFSSSIVQDFQDCLDAEEDTRSSQEYLNDLEEEYHARALLAKSKRFFKKAKYNKVKAKLALLSSSASASKAPMVKVLMALAEENNAVGKESPRNGEWVKISMRKYDIKKSIWYLDSGCSRHMTGVKSYLHKHVEQPGPKVVFGDDNTCKTEVRDVYVLDMTSSAQESCFFAKAFENLNWLWHKRLAHLNFKTINKLTKQNLVIGLPSLVYSKDKPCSSCEKGKHHKANFKTKETSFIKKCLHLPYMYLFGPVTPRSINHEKYTLVIVDEYS
ncbi:retrovirus-related pol polyprotein from transposon TNT 1-94, partial [Tanacetum coccineum]